MTRKEFREFTRNGKIIISSNEPFKNNQPSQTDPTQACPVQKIYNCLVSGVPVDAATQNVVYNGLHVDELSSLEMRHNDAFDIAREAKKIGKKFSRVAKISDVSSNSDDKK